MKLMFSQRNNSSTNPFEKDLVEDEVPSSCPSATSLRKTPFVRIPIVILCTVVVFVLLIAGTATTAISFPPKPPVWKTEDGEGQSAELVQTALDGDYKLVGPLLITAGGFLLIVDVVLCAIVTKDAYVNSRTIKPSSLESIKDPGPVSVLGGPFYLATPNPTVSNPNGMVPFAFSRHLWAMPNAPTPDFSFEEEVLKGSKVRAATATLVRGSQPPFNPDVKPIEDIT